MPITKKYGEIKPWDKLGISRQHYNATKPWKSAGIKRAIYEDLLITLPDHVLQGLREEAQAEKLVELIFGTSP